MFAALPFIIVHKERIMMRRFFFFLLLLCLLLLSNTAAGMTVTDEIGRTVAVPSPPQRIVSLAPNITETLFAIGCGERIVGVTTWCNYPNDARLKARVGDLLNPSLETIVSLEPDLIIATADGNRKETVEMLARMNYAVYVVNPSSIEGVFSMIRHLGRVTAQEKQAETLVTGLRARVERITSQARLRPRPPVFFQVGSGALISAGRHTFLDELITTAGGTNIFGDSPVRYPKAGIEEVVMRMPEVIIITAMDSGDTACAASRDWLRWDTIPAVRTGRIHCIDADLVTRPSPRIIEGLERLFDIIHPEVKNEGALF